MSRDIKWVALWITHDFRESPMWEKNDVILCYFSSATIVVDNTSSLVSSYTLSISLPSPHII
jgi:hypothetical protein